MARPESTLAARPGPTPRTVVGVSALVALLVCLTLLAAADPATAKKRATPEDLMNPMLGIDYSHWLVGAIAEIASEREQQEYLRLVDDASAAAFIAEFWEKRAADTPVFTKTPKQLYDARSAEADKRFTEAAYPGRRTDRGTVFIVFGEPETIEFRSPTRVGEPTLEVWLYPRDAEPGLGGESPKREYRFAKDGELTMHYDGKLKRPDPLQRPPRGFGY